MRKTKCLDEVTEELSTWRRRRRRQDAATNLILAIFIEKKVPSVTSFSTVFLVTMATGSGENWFGSAACGGPVSGVDQV